MGKAPTGIFVCAGGGLFVRLGRLELPRHKTLEPKSSFVVFCCCWWLVVFGCLCWLSVIFGV
nr:MAG TPA: Protein of unknown function (DUF1467) [Caudoviricetes sp.]